MDNVIQLSDLRETRGKKTMSETAAQTAISTTSGSFPDRASEKAKIRQAIERTKKLRSADMDTVAGRLWDLLERARRQKIARKAIIEKALPGKALKYLDKLTAPREGNGPSETRPGRLQQMPDNYALVAATAAHLMNEDVEDILLHLFRGTSVDDTNQALCQQLGEILEVDDCWHQLAGRINDMICWLSEKSGMQDHIRRAVTNTGAYDLGERCIRPSTGLLFPHGPLGHEYEVYDEFPPVPSILIHEETIASFTARPLELTQGDIAVHLEVDVQVVRELRLAIGPVDTYEDVGALFEVRTRVDLTGVTDGISLIRPWMYLDGTEAFKIRWKGAIWEAYLEIDPDHDPLKGERLVPLEGKGEGLGGGPLQPEHVYAIWYPVTPRTCERFLSVPVNSFQGSTGCPYDRTNLPTLCPAHTIGAAIESTLLSGAECLQDALLSEVRSISALVQAYVAGRREEAYALHQEASHRWSISK
jgi:hypothetical protein